MVLDQATKDSLNSLIENGEIGDRAFDYIKNNLSKKDSLSPTDKTELNTLIEDGEIGDRAFDFLAGKFEVTPTVVPEHKDSPSVAEMILPNATKAAETSVSETPVPSEAPKSGVMTGPNTYSNSPMENKIRDVATGALSDAASLTTRALGAAIPSSATRGTVKDEDGTIRTATAGEALASPETGLLRPVVSFFNKNLKEGVKEFSDPNTEDGRKIVSGLKVAGSGVASLIADVIQDPVSWLGIPAIYKSMRIASIARDAGISEDILREALVKTKPEMKNLLAENLTEQQKKALEDLNSSINRLDAQVSINQKPVLEHYNDQKISELASKGEGIESSINTLQTNKDKLKEFIANSKESISQVPPVEAKKELRKTQKDLSAKELEQANLEPKLMSARVAKKDLSEVSSIADEIRLQKSRSPTVADMNDRIDRISKNLKENGINTDIFDTQTKKLKLSIDQADEVQGLLFDGNKLKEFDSIPIEDWDRMETLLPGSGLYDKVQMKIALQGIKSKEEAAKKIGTILDVIPGVSQAKNVAGKALSPLKVPNYLADKLVRSKDQKWYQIVKLIQAAKGTENILKLTEQLKREAIKEKDKPDSSQ